MFFLFLNGALTYFKRTVDFRESFFVGKDSYLKLILLLSIKKFKHTVHCLNCLMTKTTTTTTTAAATTTNKQTIKQNKQQTNKQTNKNHPCEGERRCRVVHAGLF